MRRRTVLGGVAHGTQVTVLHGLTMRIHGQSYRPYLQCWWVPIEDTDDAAADRVATYLRKAS